MSYVAKPVPMRVPPGAIQTFGAVPMHVPRGAVRTFGDASSTSSSFMDYVQSDGVKYVAGALSAFHGYRRSNGSITWALLWALFGNWKPELAVPIAVAQGFGRRKVWTTEPGPR